MVFELWHMLVASAGVVGARELIPTLLRQRRERARAKEKLEQVNITNRHKALRSGNEVVKVAVDSLASELEALREERDRLTEALAEAVSARDTLIAAQREAVDEQQAAHRVEREQLRLLHKEAMASVESEKRELFGENQRLRKENEALLMENRNMQDWLDAGTKTLAEINREKGKLEQKIEQLDATIEEKVQELFKREDIRRASRIRSGG